MYGFLSNFSERKSFKLLPLMDTCPFIEAIFDPYDNVLIIMNKTHKMTNKMIPKLSKSGDLVRTKDSIMYEKATIDTYYEYSLSGNAIINFINIFCENNNDIVIEYKHIIELYKNEKEQSN